MGAGWESSDCDELVASALFGLDALLPPPGGSTEDLAPVTPRQRSLRGLAQARDVALPLRADDRKLHSAGHTKN